MRLSNADYNASGNNLDLVIADGDTTTTLTTGTVAVSAAAPLYIYVDAITGEPLHADLQIEIHMESTT